MALRAVVCTSSADLGVDFRPVEQVLQIGGSPKGIARIPQRAGRSGHQPGSDQSRNDRPHPCAGAGRGRRIEQAADARHIGIACTTW